MASRKPIQSEHPEMSVRLIHERPTLDSLLPDYRYEFTSQEVSSDAESMYSSLLDFLTTNQQLALDMGNDDIRAYSDGFRRSVALVRLWIDSMYIESTNNE